MCEHTEQWNNINLIFSSLSLGFTEGTQNIEVLLISLFSTGGFSKNIEILEMFKKVLL